MMHCLKDCETGIVHRANTYNGIMAIKRSLEKKKGHKFRHEKYMDNVHTEHVNEKGESHESPLHTEVEVLKERVLELEQLVKGTKNAEG